MLLPKLRALFNPEMYHGWGRQKNYFEGWYYKVVSENGKHAMAIIPGIAMDADGNRQAFIQILDGKDCSSEYHKFPISDFNANLQKFEVTIGKNRFSIDSLDLNLETIKGQLSFDRLQPWPSTWYSPGIMGPYSFVPFMECYHGVLSLDHDIKGSLFWRNQWVEFTGGRGYMEKDWGHSFPSAYVWMQSNHFQEKHISAKISVAKIPWLTGSFVGFIGGLWIKNQLIAFTTYNGSRLLSCSIHQDKVEITIKKGLLLLYVTANRPDATELASPIQGFMDGRIEESMTATLTIRLENTDSGEIVFEGEGVHSGIEVAGNISEIIL